MQRAKLLSVLFSILGVVALVSWFFLQRTQDAQDTDLARQASRSITTLRSDMDWSRQQLLTTSQQAGMLEIMRDPASRSIWKPQIDRSLEVLTRDNPGRIDEACLINPLGAEQARVVGGVIPPESDLSEDEKANPFFGPTTALGSGQVYNQIAYLSPDTGRWVLSWSTPLYNGTIFYGMFHFETPLAHYYQLLGQTEPSDGFVMLADSRGRIFLDTSSSEPKDESLGYVRNLTDDPDLDNAAQAILRGATGFATGKVNGQYYRLRYEGVQLSPGSTTTVVTAAPDALGAFSPLRPFVLPVAIGALALALAMLLLSRSSEAVPQALPAAGD